MLLWFILKILQFFLYLLHVQLIGMKEILLVLVQNVDQAFIIVLYNLESIREGATHSSYIVNNLFQIVLVILRKVLVQGNR